MKRAFKMMAVFQFALACFIAVCAIGMVVCNLVMNTNIWLNVLMVVLLFLCFLLIRSTYREMREEFNRKDKGL